MKQPRYSFVLTDLTINDVLALQWLVEGHHIADITKKLRDLIVRQAEDNHAHYSKWHEADFDRRRREASQRIEIIHCADPSPRA